MATNWYPIIDTEKCIECNACIDKCTRGVYEEATMPPVVRFAENCSYGCKGCAAKCPVDAISYKGDEPQLFNMIKTSCNCSK